MITGIEIERLRGIHEGKLEGLTPLTILVGPSGAGKSTILDALLIAGAAWPDDAIGHVVQRRSELPAGGPWLFERLAGTARIKLHGEHYERVAKLSWRENSVASDIHVEIDSPMFNGLTSFKTAENIYSAGQRSGPFSAHSAWMIETSAGANHAPLVRLYNRVLQNGGAATIDDLVASVIDGAKGLMFGTYRDRNQDLSIVHINFVDHSVPVAGAGSGVYSLVRLALELAAPPGDVLLVEEPEAHQHPAVISQAAKLLLAAARRDVQLIVSTHSLELIDSIVTNASEQDLELLSVFRVVLDKGVLRSSRYPGPMVRTALFSLGEDLR